MSEAVTKMPVPQAPAVVTPMAMIDRAIASGANIETLERLMALQERWEASEARREFDEAISLARAEIRPIIKTRTVDFSTAKGRTNYTYEDLASISDAVDPILSRHGLSYRYRSAQDGPKVRVTCIISHSRGHREETSLEAHNDETGNKNSIQAVGSALTYLQRYSLKLALGLAAAPDDDARAANGDMPKTIDAAQFRYLRDMIEESNSVEAKVLEFAGVASLEELTQVQFKKVEAALRGRLAAMKKAAK